MSRLRWIFVCRFGRRCGNLQVTPMNREIPESWTIHSSYICQGCGSVYEDTFTASGKKLSHKRVDPEHLIRRIR